MNGVETSTVPAMKIAGVLRRLNLGVALIFGTVLLITVALILLEVLGRQFPAIRIGGADEISGYVMAGLATWGFSYTLVERAHVRIDLLHARLPSPGRALFDILALASVAVIAALVSYYAYDVLAKSLAADSRSNTPLAVPLWIPQIVWFLGWCWLLVTSGLMFVSTIMLAAAGRFFEVEQVAGINVEAEEL
jgi:TRAP-type C4-dicarboxylate transport system permease small subunit